MINTRAFAQIALVLATLVTPSTAAVAATAQSASSKELLLSPRVHAGQSFTWKGRIRARTAVPTNNGWVERFDSRALILTCSILRGGSNAFLVTRQVKVDAGPGKTIAVVRNDSVSNQRIVVEPKPSIIIRNGREFGTDGPPLNYDPICKFYSVTMFGVPPPTLKVGSTWRFGQTTFVGHVYSVRGTTTVTNLDSRIGSVSLRVKMIDNRESKIVALVDLVVMGGGAVVSETDRQGYVYVAGIPKEIGTPSYVAVWSLHHP